MIPRGGHVLDWVDDYLHEVLGSDDTTYVENHCNRCQICNAGLEEARKRLDALRTVPPNEASEPLIQATLNLVEHEERRWQRLQRLRRFLTWGVLPPSLLSLALLAILYIYTRSISATPYDLQVFGQNQFLAGSSASLRVRLLNQRTNKPLASVPIEIELRGQGQIVKLASFSTDAQGTGQPRLLLPDWPDGEYELRVAVRSRSAPEELFLPVQFVRSSKLMLSTDKLYYQPGDAIHVRSLILRQPDLHPIGGTDVLLRINDPRDHLIYERHVLTSNFGIASFDCLLAHEIITGTYTLTCEAGFLIQRTSIEVKSVPRPRFKVDLKLDQSFYRPGQSVQANITAEYLFGKPIAGGRVELQARLFGGESKVLYRGQTKTDEFGKATLLFPLPASIDGASDPVHPARIAVEATVIDATAQKEAETVSCPVAINPLLIEVIPEYGPLVQEVANTVYLYVHTPDGRPAKARLQISDVGKEVVTNDLGVASLEITPHSTVEWQIQASDDKGNRGQRDVQLHCGRHEGDFLLRTDKAVYDGGATMQVTAFGGWQDPIFIDVIKDGQTVLTNVVEMSNGHGQHDIPLPDNVFGTVQLCAYRFATDGRLVYKTRSFYVRPAKQLRLSVNFNHQIEYHPGDQAKLAFSLQDAQGNPVSGAISVAVRDKAIASPAVPAIGDEPTYFTLDQERLRALLDRCAWSPETIPNALEADTNCFEQALFACTVESNNVTEEVHAPQRRHGSSSPGLSLPPRTMAKIPHTLVASSLPSKRRQAAELQRDAMFWVRGSWLLFLGILVLSGLTAMWLFLRPFWLVVILQGVLGIILGLLIYGGLDSFTPLPVPVEEKTILIPPAFQSLPNRSENTATTSDAPTSQATTWLPPTLLWRPELLTDELGHANLDVELDRNIADWQLSASAIATDGQLGQVQTILRVFQPFETEFAMPSTLTCEDEVIVPVRVSNRRGVQQTVKVKLLAGDGFDLVEGESSRSLGLKPYDVCSTGFHLRARKAGVHQIQVQTQGPGSDAGETVQRTVQILSPGRRVERVFNGTLGKDAHLNLAVPANAVPGSVRAILKIYPSLLSQVIEEARDASQPRLGSSEEIVTALYRKVLALACFQRIMPRIPPEMKTRLQQALHLDYQRLLPFESSGAGFSWLGGAPASPLLSACALMALDEMARFQNMDPRPRERIRSWLLAERGSDGSWTPEVLSLGSPAQAGIRDRTSYARLGTTAYLAWMIFRHQPSDDRDKEKLKYLSDNNPEKLHDPYLLALLANALYALDPRSEAIRPYLQRLEALKHSDANDKLVWWEPASDTQTLFQARDTTASVETTALAVLALQAGEGFPETMRAAAGWLLRQRDARGTWGSPQATLLALQALFNVADASFLVDNNHKLSIVWDRGSKKELDIPPDQIETPFQEDLSEPLRQGSQHVTIQEFSGITAGYQLILHYHVPHDAPLNPKSSWAINLHYERDSVRLGERLPVIAAITNQRAQTAFRVVVDLPIPAGFTLVQSDLERLQASGTIAKYQISSSRARLYLREVGPGKSISLPYQLYAQMEAKIQALPAQVYEISNRHQAGVSKPIHLTITPSVP